jgi:hypothetical protein
MARSIQQAENASYGSITVTYPHPQHKRSAHRYATHPQKACRGHWCTILAPARTNMAQKPRLDPSDLASNPQKQCEIAEIGAQSTWHTYCF